MNDEERNDQPTEFIAHRGQKIPARSPDEFVLDIDAIIDKAAAEASKRVLSDLYKAFNRMAAQ